MKPKTDKERATAEFVVKGVLTRLALMFEFSGRSFTGREVAEILVAAMPKHPATQALPDGSRKGVVIKSAESSTENGAAK